MFSSKWKAFCNGAVMSEGREQVKWVPLSYGGEGSHQAVAFISQPNLKKTNIHNQSCHNNKNACGHYTNPAAE